MLRIIPEAQNIVFRVEKIFDWGYNGRWKYNQVTFYNGLTDDQCFSNRTPQTSLDVCFRRSTALCQVSIDHRRVGFTHLLGSIVGKRKINQPKCTTQNSILKILLCPISLGHHNQHAPQPSQNANRSPRNDRI